MNGLPQTVAALEGKTILRVVWTSLAVGIGLTAVFSVGLFAATRFAEVRSEHRALAAVYGALAALALAVCGAGVVLGLIIMARK